MQPVTIAQMISFHDPTPVELPSKYVEKIVGKAESAILILRPHDQIIHLIPTQNQTGIKIIFDIVKFSSSFFLEFSQILSRHQLNTLFFTGLYSKFDSCIYEGYFDLNELPVSEALLIEELSEIPGVSKVEINHIE